MSGKQRFRELDGLRGIAALAVVLTHYTMNFDLFFPQHNDLGWGFEYGYFGVNLFFMISGFVIFMTSRRYTTSATFGLARAVRLYPTYWVCLTITVLAVFAFPPPTRELFRPAWEIVVNYSMMQSMVAVRDFDGAYWSLSREIVFYFLIAVALWLFNRRIPNEIAYWGGFAWSFGGTLLILVAKTLDIGILNLITQASVAQYAPLFALGMALFLFTESGRFHPLIWVQVVLAGINEGLMSHWFNGIVVSGLAMLFIAVIVVRDVPILRVKILLWLGAISYPLYLVHQNVGYVVMDKVVSFVGPVGGRIVAIALAVFLAWVVHEIVEIRVTRWLHKKLWARMLPEKAAVTAVQ